MVLPTQSYKQLPQRGDGKNRYAKNFAAKNLGGDSPLKTASSHSSDLAHVIKRGVHEPNGPALTGGSGRGALGAEAGEQEGEGDGHGPAVNHLDDGATDDRLSPGSVHRDGGEYSQYLQDRLRTFTPWFSENPEPMHMSPPSPVAASPPLFFGDSDKWPPYRACTSFSHDNNVLTASSAPCWTSNATTLLSTSLEIGSDPLDSTKIAGLKLKDLGARIGRLTVSELHDKTCLRGQQQRRFSGWPTYALEGENHTRPLHWLVKCASRVSNAIFYCATSWSKRSVSRQISSRGCQG